MTALLGMGGYAFAADQGGAVVGTIGQSLRTVNGVAGEFAVSSKVSVTGLGAAMADAARLSCGTDLAMIDGGRIFYSLPAGEVTQGALENTVSENSILAITSVSGSQLWQLAEIGVGHLMVSESEDLDIEASDFDGFPQISGFTLTCDISAPVGERVIALQLDDGTLVDPANDESRYTMAAPEELFSGVYGYPEMEYTVSGISCTEALSAYISQGIERSYDTANERIEVIGTNESKWMGEYSRSWILVCAVLGIIAVLSTRRAAGRSGWKEKDIS